MPRAVERLRRKTHVTLHEKIHENSYAERTANAKPQRQKSSRTSKNTVKHLPCAVERLRRETHTSIARKGQRRTNCECKAACQTLLPLA
ncbi:MAG: hypothetical protein ACI4QH_00190 [Candidatus Fimimonas sp.]